MMSVKVGEAYLFTTRFLQKYLTIRPMSWWFRSLPRQTWVCVL